MAVNYRALFVLLALATLAAACGGGAGGKATSIPSATPEATGAPTMKSLDEALALLQAEPNVQIVLNAIEASDVDGLLGLIDWQPAGCGSPHGMTDICPTGVVQNTELPMAYVGFGESFQVTDATLRPALTQILSGSPLTVSFVARSAAPADFRGAAVAPGPVYLVGLEGTPRPVDASVIWGDAGEKTGLFLELNAGSAHPVIELGDLSETWAAAQQGFEFVRDLSWLAIAPPAISATKPPQDGSRLVLQPKPCAFNSTERFLEIQRQASFAVYCPTYLPGGFRLDHAVFASAKPGSVPDQVVATFVDDAKDEALSFIQGLSGSDVFPNWRLYTQPPSEPVRYGDFSATLYDEYTFPDGSQESAVVWADAPDGKLHLIFGSSPMLDTATMRQIAEGMVRVSSQ
jgi:hypothetical protein